MRAVGVIEFGGPEALQVVDVPETHAGPGEVRIRVHATAVSPTDTVHRSGARAERLSVDPPPYIPGMDVAGVIDQIGDGTDTDLAVGDRVMAMVIPSGSHGGYRESIVLAADSVARAPAGSSHAEASTLPMNGLTAQLALDLLALDAGQTIAVTGAAGTFGGYVVELAHAAGLRVIADAAEKDVALVEGFGADVVLPRGDDIAARIRELEPDGVDAVVDGAVMNELAIGAVKDGGGFATVRGFPGSEERGITFHQVWVTQYDGRRDLLEGLRQQVEDDALSLRVAHVFPPEQGHEAHRVLEAGGTRGRCVIEFP